jgi:mRNA-degrading endonuclease YafQ of YafQ-DinJ toxin-antitoxin module
MILKILTYSSFDKVVKKLHRNSKLDLDNAVRFLSENPTIGELKKGDLAGIRIHKFKMVNQLTLLAYIYDEKEKSITLIALGSHENFYRDLKSI